LARDASSSGDYVSAENFFQHAEHYYRILSANGGTHAGLQRLRGPQQGQPPQRAPGEQARPEAAPGPAHPPGGNGAEAAAPAVEEESLGSSDTVASSS